MRGIAFLIIFTFVFNSITFPVAGVSVAFAAETSGGGGGARSGAISKPTKEVFNGVTLTREPCPKTLKESVLDDFADKRFGLFKSESGTCQGYVKGYEAYINGKSETLFKSPDDLGKELSSQFKDKLSPTYQSYFAGCSVSGSGLTPEQVKVAQTRFYSGALQIEKFNSEAADEIAYLDSVIPGNKPLEGIECTPAMPALKKKCDALRSASEQCATSNKARFDAMVEKTEKALAQIAGLDAGYRECMNKNPCVKVSPGGRGCMEKAKSEACEKIATALDLVKKSVPWVTGEEFNKLAVKEKPNTRGGKFLPTYKDRAGIAAGLEAQLKANRKILADNSKKNMEDFSCLTYNTDFSGSKCNYNKIRENLSKFSAPEVPFNKNDRRRSNELKSYFEAEQCFVDRGVDRNKTINIVDDAAINIGLTVATAGAGVLATGLTRGSKLLVAGKQVPLIAPKVGARLGPLLVGGAELGNIGNSLKDAAKECMAANQVPGVQLGQPLEVANTPKGNVCTDPKSPLALQQEAEQNCAVTALLAVGTDVLPFLAGVPSIQRAVKSLTSKGKGGAGAAGEALADAGKTTPPAAGGAATPAKPTTPDAQKPDAAAKPVAEKKPEPKTEPKPDANAPKPEDKKLTQAEKDELAAFTDPKPKPETKPEGPKVTEMLSPEEISDPKPTQVGNPDASPKPEPKTTLVAKSDATPTTTTQSEVPSILQPSPVKRDIPNADGGDPIKDVQIISSKPAANGQVEVTFQKPDGSIGSRVTTADAFARENDLTILRPKPVAQTPTPAAPKADVPDAPTPAPKPVAQAPTPAAPLYKETQFVNPDGRIVNGTPVARNGDSTTLLVRDASGKPSTVTVRNSEVGDQVSDRVVFRQPDGTYKVTPSTSNVPDAPAPPVTTSLQPAPTATLPTPTPAAAQSNFAGGSIRNGNTGAVRPTSGNNGSGMATGVDTPSAPVAKSTPAQAQAPTAAPTSQGNSGNFSSAQSAAPSGGGGGSSGGFSGNSGGSYADNVDYTPRSTANTGSNKGVQTVKGKVEGVRDVESGRTIRQENADGTTSDMVVMGQGPDNTLVVKNANGKIENLTADQVKGAKILSPNLGEKTTPAAIGKAPEMPTSVFDAPKVDVTPNAGFKAGDDVGNTGLRVGDEIVNTKTGTTASVVGSKDGKPVIRTTDGDEYVGAYKPGMANVEVKRTMAPQSGFAVGDQAGNNGLRIGDEIVNTKSGTKATVVGSKDGKPVIRDEFGGDSVASYSPDMPNIKVNSPSGSVAAKNAVDTIPTNDRLLQNINTPEAGTAVGVQKNLRVGDEVIDETGKKLRVIGENDTGLVVLRDPTGKKIARDFDFDSEGFDIIRNNQTKPMVKKIGERIKDTDIPKTKPAMIALDQADNRATRALAKSLDDAELNLPRDREILQRNVFQGEAPELGLQKYRDKVNSAKKALDGADPAKKADLEKALVDAKANLKKAEEKLATDVATVRAKFESLPKKTQDRIQAEYKELEEIRLRKGEAEHRQSIDDLEKSGDAKVKEANCGDFNQVYQRAFATGKANKCHVVETEKDTNGFCGCGGAKGPPGFLSRCAENVSQYKSVGAFQDGFALSVDNALEKCYRVTIPKGTTCLAGATGPTFAGGGGKNQIVCLLKQSARADAELARKELAKKLGKDITYPPSGAYKVVNSSPLSNNPELYAPLDKIRQCMKAGCTKEEFAKYQKEIQDTIGKLESDPRMLDPEFKERLLSEKKLFDEYFVESQAKLVTANPKVEIAESVPLKPEFVRPGDNIRVSQFDGGADDLNATIIKRNPDGSARVRDEKGAEFDLLPDEVRSATYSRDLPTEVKKNLDIIEDADRVKAAENYVNRPLTSAQQQAVVDVHRIADDKKIFQLTKSELKAKTEGLRKAGFSADEADLLIRKGVVGGNGTPRIVAEQPTVPDFNVSKGQGLKFQGKSGKKYDAEVVSNPDKSGKVEIEFFEPGKGVGRTRVSVNELRDANIPVAARVDNPVVNVPVAGKDVSYPGKVVGTKPDSKGFYQVEVQAPGKPPYMTRVSEADLKAANTPQAVREAKIRDARRSGFATKSNAELEQIASDSFRKAELNGARDKFDVTYGSSGQPVRTLKQQKIDIEGQRAIEELAKRQNKAPNDLYAEIGATRKQKPAPVQAPAKVEAPVPLKKTYTAAEAYNSPQAQKARNELDYLAEQGNFKGSKMSLKQREDAGLELGLNENQTGAMDYKPLANKLDSKKLFDKVFADQATGFDVEQLRQTMSFNPKGGYVGQAEFVNADKFVTAVKKADIDPATLSVAERKMLNDYTERATQYARQINPDAPSLPVASLDPNLPKRVNTSSGNQPSGFASGDGIQVRNYEDGTDATFTVVGDAPNGRLKVKDEKGQTFELIPDEVKGATKVEAPQPIVKAKTETLVVPKEKGEPTKISQEFARPGDQVTVRNFEGGDDLNGTFVRKNSDGSVTIKDEKGKELKLSKSETKDAEFNRELSPEVKRNGNLSDEARVTAAEDYLKRQLTPAQSKAVVDAHNVGGGTSTRGFYNYTKAELKQKTEILRKAGFTNAEASLLLRKGVAGSNPTTLADNILKVDPTDVRRGDKIEIEEFNGTGKFRGEVVGPAKNGGFEVRDLDSPNSTLTIYRSDLADANNSSILRDVSKPEAPAVKVLDPVVTPIIPKEIVKVDPSDVKAGDIVELDSFNGTGKFRGQVERVTGDGKYKVRDLDNPNSSPVTLYKSDLNEIFNTKITREVGAPIPKSKPTPASEVLPEPKSLGASGGKNNPVVNVPVGPGDTRPGKVIFFSQPQAGVERRYTLSFVDNFGQESRIVVGQNELLKANTPASLRQAKIGEARRANFAKKSTDELEQIIEGNVSTLAKSKKGVDNVDYNDLSLDAKSAAEELSRRSKGVSAEESVANIKQAQADLKAQRRQMDVKAIRAEAGADVQLAVSSRSYQANAVNGDLVKVFKSADDGNVHFLVGDSVSHGKSSGKSSVATNNFIENQGKKVLAEAREKAVKSGKKLDANDELKILDNAVVEARKAGNGPDLTAPSTHMVLNPKTGELQTAGSADMFVVRKSGEVQVAGTKTVLKEGDTVVAVTDGLKDRFAKVSTDGKKVSDGKKELQQILEAQARSGNISPNDINKAIKPKGSDIIEDDATSLVFQYKPVRETPNGISGLASPNPTRVPASTVKPSELKTGDFAVTASAGDNVKVPANKGTTDGVLLGKSKQDGETFYNVGTPNKDGSMDIRNVSERQFADANPDFVAVKPQSTRSLEPGAIRVQIDDDIKKAKSVDELQAQRAKSMDKAVEKQGVEFNDGSAAKLEGEGGVTLPDGRVLVNNTKPIDQQFSNLVHEVSQKNTGIKNGDIKLKSTNRELSADGYSGVFARDEIKAAKVNFAADKQSALAYAKEAVDGAPNLSMKVNISDMQKSIDRRQGFISDLRASLDQVDEAIPTIKPKAVEKKVITVNGKKQEAEFQRWEIELSNVEGKTGPIEMSFSTPKGVTREQAIDQLKDYVRREKVNLLADQSKLDYDRAYLKGLRDKVNVPEPQRLAGPSLFDDAKPTGGRANMDENIKYSISSNNQNPATAELVNDLDAVIAERAKKLGVRDTREITPGHPLYQTVEKQRQLVNRLRAEGRFYTPDSFARTATDVADDLVKKGDIDLARAYYKAASDTVEQQLGKTAKNFWKSEDDINRAIKSGFAADNPSVAHMATDNLITLKAGKKVDPDAIKRVARDTYYNLGYKYDQVLYGVKRYGNKGKELDLLTIRKQQQYLAEKYNLKAGIENEVGQDVFKKMDDQADISVDSLIKDPKQIIDPDKFKDVRPRSPAADLDAPKAPSDVVPGQVKNTSNVVTRSTPQLEKKVDAYIQSLKGSDLTEKEIRSVAHQEDLIAASRNPEVTKILDDAQVDYEGMKFGMLDSDVGKEVKFQENLLIKPTKESDELFDGIRGAGKSPASKAIKDILEDAGFPNGSLLNPNLTNQEIRDIISEVPALRGYLHELPGMQIAIRDFNQGNITLNQFRERFLANLGHNGPDDGFWGKLTSEIIPNGLGSAKNPKAKELFKNSIFDSKVVENGVTMPKYPEAQTPAAITHLIFDRLSQGTRGGVGKIFYELGGAPLQANPKIRLGDIGFPPNKGLGLPNEMLFGNPEKTLKQLATRRQQTLNNKKLSGQQKEALNNLLDGASDRIKKQNEFIEKNVEVVKDADGNIEKINLKYVDEKGKTKLVTFTNDTPSEDVAKAMDNLLKHEERINGEPFKDFKVRDGAEAPQIATVGQK